MAEGNGGVQFTIKEMFADIRTTLVSIEDKLDQKADKLDVVQARADINRHELLLTKIENRDAARAEEMSKLKEQYSSMQKAFYTSALSVMVGVLVFALSVSRVFGG